MLQQVAFLFLAILFIAGCAADKQSANQSTIREQTVFSTSESNTATPADSVVTDTTFYIGKHTKFSLKLMVKPLPDSLQRPAKQVDENETDHPVYFRNRLYSIAFLRNDSLLFQQRFSYKDLLQQELMILDEYQLSPPQLLYFLPQHRQIVFTLSQDVPETDIGETYVLVYDFEGNRKYYELHTMHGGCNSEIALSSNGRYLLSCSSLYDFSQQKKIDFQKDDYADAGSFFISDSAFLLVKDFETGGEYEVEDGLKAYKFNYDTISPNAYIISIGGDTLHKFLCKGLVPGLGSSIASCAGAGKDLHILLDVPQNQLIYISRNTPGLLKFYSLDSLASVKITNLKKYNILDCNTESNNNYKLVIDKNRLPLSLLIE